MIQQITACMLSAFESVYPGSLNWTLYEDWFVM